MPNNVQAVTLTSTNTAVSSRCRIKAIYYVAAASAGSVVIKDGGASGTTILNIATPASATATDNVFVPDGGILCSTDAHATITNVTSVTIFYDR